MPVDDATGTRVSWSCVAWWPHSRRSEAFADALGANLHCIYYSRFQSRALAPFRYALQAIHTLWVLGKEHPVTVHVQNPPFVCGLVVYLYSLMAGAKFVLDHHSAAFAGVWDKVLPIQRFVARRALTNIVTSRHWAERIHDWKASAFVMSDPFLPLPPGQTFQTEPGFSIAFVCTFSPDEPYDEVLRAVSHLPDVHFYITGKPDPAILDRLGRLPSNVTLTRFLPDAQYIGLLRSVDAVMALTTRDHTLQLGGCEAVSAGKPLLTSDWPFLREVFPRGAVYTSNTSAGIRQAVIVMQREHVRLRSEMLRFREDARHGWQVQIDRLNELAVKSIHETGGERG